MLALNRTDLILAATIDLDRVISCPSFSLPVMTLVYFPGHSSGRRQGEHPYGIRRFLSLTSEACGSPFPSESRSARGEPPPGVRNGIQMRRSPPIRFDPMSPFHWSACALPVLRSYHAPLGESGTRGHRPPISARTKTGHHDWPQVAFWSMTLRRPGIALVAIM